MTVPTTPAPGEGPATLAAVRARLPQNGTGVTDDELRVLVAAVNRRAARWVSREPDGSWAPDHALGASLLAARLYARRNSPAGVQTFGTEGTAYVVRQDPDVAMLLQLGPYAVPRVG